MGVHSVGEQVELHFGDGLASVAEASPPRRPSPFAFDLAEYCAREGGAVRAPAAAAAGRARDREAAQSSHPRLQAERRRPIHAYPPPSSESSRPGPRQAEEEGGGE